MEVVLLIGGLVVLIISGELLVKGAVGLAKGFKISTLVIGMTVVSFGTSVPELLVSLKAALDGHPDISIGNVIGSNMANLGLVLGITAIILPIAVGRNSMRFDWPMMMISTIVLVLFMLDGELVFWEGVVLLVSLIAFSAWLILNSRKGPSNEGKEEGGIEKPSALFFGKNLGFVALGCVGLMFGADWLLEGAVNLAKSWGVSDHVIGVTIVAFGTSLPELITSVIAAFRKQVDISVGNLIGSNLFNISAILGITSIVTDIPIFEKVLEMDIYWLLGISLLVYPIMRIGRSINRIEGGLLFLVYIFYILIQI